MRRTFVLVILSIFFLENIELDSVCMCGVEFLHSRAEFLRKMQPDESNLYDIVYSPDHMTFVNDHEIIVDGQYFDIVKEKTIGTVHHYYCKADKAEGALMNFISWLKTNKENNTPYSPTGILKSKLKSIKYLARSKSMICGRSELIMDYKSYKTIFYISPEIQTPVPPPLS